MRAPGASPGASNGNPAADPGAGRVYRPPLRPLPRRRRPATIALAIAMIALGGTTGAWLLSRSGDTQSVLVVAQRVARGEVVQPTDLTTAELPVGVLNLRTVPAARLAEVVGGLATADLMAGSVLTPDSVTAELVPGPGNSVVGVALTPAQMPGHSVASGDHVRFVATPQVGGDLPVGDPETIEAVVINAQAGDAGWLLNVELPTSVAPRLAALAATTRIALVIDTAG